MATENLRLHYVDSEDPTSYPAVYAFDGDPNTFWHTEFRTNVPPPPHELQIDLGSVLNLQGFRYLPRQDNFYGNIGRYEFYMSSDGFNWGTPVASGSFLNSSASQEVTFVPTSGRYVRLRALSEINGLNQSAVAELTFLQADSSPIEGTNTAPSAIAQTLSTAEDVQLPISLAGIDGEGSALNYAVVTGPVNGTLAGTAPNLTYSPGANFNGSDSFAFRVNDGSLNSATATVSISVTPVNDVPVAESKSVSTSKDTPAAITLSGFDIESSPLTFSIVNGPANGTLTGIAPNLVYSPSAGSTGSDSFTYRVNDGAANSAAATVSITVTPVNTPPVATSNLVTTPEDSSIAITLAGSDKDLNTLTFSVVTGPSNGTLTGTPPNLSYSPTKNFSGSDTVTFRVNDGTVDSAPAAVSITVTPVNDAPLATSKSVTTDEDTQLPIILGGTDPEASSLSFTVLTVPTHGTLTGTAPNLTYSPAANFSGADQFTFSVNDGTINSAPATVSIAVKAVNDAPVALSNSASTEQDTPLPFTLAGTDVEGSSLTFSVVSGPTNGTLGGTAPNLTYQPAAGFSGSDAFTFRANDGTTTSPTATVSITVSQKPLPSNVNRLARTGWTLKYVDSEQTPKSPATSAFDGNPSTIWQTRNSSGSAALPHEIQINLGSIQNIAGFQYLPRQDLSTVGNIGNYEFYVSLDGVTWGSPVATGKFANSAFEKLVTFTAKTGKFIRLRALSEVNGGNSTCVAELSILQELADNQPPLATPLTLTTGKDTSLQLLLGGSDPEGSALTYSIVNGPLNGTLTGTAPNLTYLPNSGFVGGDQFTFQTHDGAASSATATVSINVTAVTVVPENTAPVFTANPIILAATEGASFSGQLLATDANAGDILTFQKVSGPAWLTVAADGKLGGTPLSADVGTGSFIVSASDPSNAAATATLTITVAATTNASPVFLVKPLEYPAGTEKSLYLGQTLASTATDPNADDTIIYSKVAGPAWLVVANSGALSGTPPSGSVGTNLFTVRATDAAGSFDETTLQIKINANTLPLPWNLDRVGNENIAGTATYGSTIYTLAGAGLIDLTEDSGSFGWQTLSGDGKITARVSKLNDTGTGTRVGVMIRESLAANSRHIFFGVDGTGNYQWTHRLVTGGYIAKSTRAGQPTAKIWVRLIRNANVITVYQSTTGTSWTKIGSSTVTLPKNCYIGLWVGSGDKGLLNNSQFSNVAVTP
ncbi:MAG: Ig-like domain-containing protein [Verrucomicrobiota bacterium]